jgi:hypothetical protein
MEPGEERGRAGSVEAFVVIEHPNPQTRHFLSSRNRKNPELLSIKG